MTGAGIVGALLLNPEPIENVPAGNIKAGRLPDNIALPALLVRTVSINEQLRLKRGPVVRTIERVSIAVRAGSYREQVALIRRIRSRCAGFVGDLTIGETVVRRIAVTLAGTGPDVSGPGNSFEQTIDLRVSFDEPA